MEEINWLQMQSDLIRLQSILFQLVPFETIDEMFFESLLIYGNMKYAQDYIRQNPQYLEKKK